MKRLLHSIPPKLRLYLPIAVGILVGILIISGYSVHKINSTARRVVEENLQMEVATVKKMFEREHALKLQKVKTDLKVAHKQFYEHQLLVFDSIETIAVVNQISHRLHKAEINVWHWNGKKVFGDFSFVNQVHDIVGGTTTIFQKSDSGYVRISTNVPDDKGQPAVGTYIPNNSPVVRTVEKGETYFGRAYVVNDWYITAYEPIYYDGEIKGMLYVGDKEKDIDELRMKLMELTVGHSGALFVLDEDANFIIKPETNLLPDKKYLLGIFTGTDGLLTFPELPEYKNSLIYYDYFPEFRLLIGAIVNPKEETKIFSRDLILNSSIIALLVVLIIALVIYRITAENVGDFLREIDISGQKLKHTEKALEQSERHFSTLFNNISDEIYVVDSMGSILEVNQAACDNMGYSHEEFRKLKILDIRSPKFRDQAERNLITLKKIGQLKCESENITREGKIVPVELNSRAFAYKNKEAFLMIARDITDRIEMEEKILTSIIKTEEKERRRFAADLHDDLGPILSTVKLYTDLLKKRKTKNIDEDGTIDTIEELVDNAIKTARQISRNIRPGILQDFGLAVAITDFCNYIARTKQVNINLNTQHYKIEQRGIEETILYQALKELINNTLKYAEAENIKIDLKSFEQQIILYYRDDGVGFDVPKIIKTNDGLGLRNIMNKIRSVKGTVDLNSEPGKGMFLIASVKIKKQQHGNN